METEERDVKRSRNESDWRDEIRVREKEKTVYGGSAGLAQNLSRVLSCLLLRP